MTESEPPKLKKTIFGILAWVLPFILTSLGYLFATLATPSDYPGLGIIAVFSMPFFIGLCLAPILAIIALLRREPWPALSWILLSIISFCLIFSFIGPLTAITTFIIFGVTIIVVSIKRNPKSKQPSPPKIPSTKKVKPNRIIQAPTWFFASLKKIILEIFKVIQIILSLTSKPFAYIWRKINYAETDNIEPNQKTESQSINKHQKIGRNLGWLCGALVLLGFGLLIADMELNNDFVAYDAARETILTDLGGISMLVSVIIAAFSAFHGIKGNRTNHRKSYLGLAIALIILVIFCMWLSCAIGCLF